MLTSKVLMADGRLEADEAAFLEALLPRVNDWAISEHATTHAARWESMVGVTPKCLTLAATHDRRHDSHLVDHIEAIALRAAAIAQPAMIECEFRPIRQYFGFLRGCVAELGR